MPAGRRVWILWHTRNSGSSGREDQKLVGVYSSEEKAQAARRNTASLPGFCDYPDGFEISDYAVDRSHWETGFVTV